MIKRLKIGLFICVLMANSALFAQEQAFLSVLEDVPLMAGLSEETDNVVYFDTPAGRIVETYALGSVTKTSILTYYKDSLPALGWSRTAHGTYEREGESLSVSVKMEGETAIVRFALSPNAK